MTIEINKSPNNELINSYKNGDIDAFCQLIKDGENVNCLDRNGHSLISLVIENDSNLKINKKFFKALIDAGVSMEQIGLEQGLLTLSVSCQDDIYYAKTLLDNKININSTGVSHAWHDKANSHQVIKYGPPIFDSLMQGSMEHFNLFLGYNPDLEICDPTFSTLLNFYISGCLDNFSKEENIQILSTLIEKCEDINESDYSGNTPLMHMVFSNDKNLYNILLKKIKKEDIDIKDEYGDTALMIAIKISNYAGSEILIKNGANVNTYNLSNENPLTIAVSRDSVKIFKLLLENGANLLSVDKNGNNIMHFLIDGCKEYDTFIDGKESYETYKKYYKIILKEHPELLSMKNKKGQTPSDMIKDKEYFNNFIPKRKNKNTNQMQY